jgi:PAS domain S-box-containing protein
MTLGTKTWLIAGTAMLGLVGALMVVSSVLAVPGGGHPLLIVVGLLAGVALALLPALVLQRAILRRVRGMGARIADVALRADTSIRVDVEAQDELGDLAGGINAMLDALDRARRQRDEMDERFRAVVEQASEGILLVDPDTTRIIESNEAFQHLVERDARELRGSTLEELLQDPRREIPAMVERLVAGAPPETRELPFRGLDGALVDLEVAANVVTYAGRRVVCALVRDISEERRSREVVRRREAILEAVSYAAERLLQEGEASLPDVLGRLGAATRSSRVYVFENHLKEGVLLTSQRYEWVAPGIEPQLDNPALRSLSLERSGMGRWERILSAGGTVHGLVREFPPGEQAVLAPQGIRSVLAVPMFVGDRFWGFIGFDDCLREREWSPAEVDGLRAAAGILGAAIQRERVERAQAEADARYRALVEQVPAIVYTAEFGDDGVWRYVSPQIERMLGFSSEEWTIDPELWDRQIHPDDRERVIREEQRSEATGEPLSSEYRMFARDGTLRWFRDEATVRRDGYGQPLLQGVMYDITDRAEAEERLRRHNEYLRALHDTALALMDRLDASDLLETIVRRAAALAGTEHGWLYVLEADAEHMEFRIGIGALAPSVGRRIRKGEGVSGLVWETGERVVVEDYDAWERRLPGFPEGLSGMAGVPLKSGGEVVGVIGLAHLEERRRFAPEEVDLLSGLAELASIALDNARLYEATRHEQDRARTLSDAALEGIVIVEEGRIVEANRAFSRMFSRPSDDLVGLPVEELVAEGSRDHLRERLRAPSPDPVELEGKRRDGIRLVLEVQTRAMSLMGRPVRVAAVRDVTERKRAEEEVRLLHAITLAMAEAEDPDAALEVAVREVCRATGWDLGEAWTPFPDGDSLVCSRASYLRDPALQPFRAHSERLTLRRGEGLPGRAWASRTPVWVEDISTLPDLPRGPVAEQVGLRGAAAFPVLAGREVVAVLGFFLVEPHPEDTRLVKTVSAVAAQLGSLVRRKRAEEAVRAAEEKYRGIFEEAAEGIFRMTPDGRYESVNPALAAMLGYDAPAEMLAEGLEASSVHADPERLAVWRRRLERRGRLREFEYEARRRDGRTIWVSENARVILDQEGEPLAIEGTMLDLTQRRRAEESLRQAYEREREVAERLRAVDEMKNAFLAAVSHELRTPVANILGFSLTLVREDLELPTEDVREMLERTAVNARKLERLLSDLLDLDRMTRGILEPRRRAVDVGALARGVAEEAEMRGRPVTVKAGSARAYVDAPKVERILENLLANAAKYTPPGTHVWVRVRGDERGVLLIVEDDGPGVPEGQRTLIFEPFRQGDGTPPHAPGTGVGLSLVARFAELHGGRAWVEGRRGGGASFRVFLPAVSPEEQGEGSDQDPREELLGEAASS